MRIISSTVHELLLIILAVCTLVSPSCFGIEEPGLITDRPDQTESSSTVPQGSIQIETGWLHTNNNNDDLETDALPQTLLRYGITEKLELRFIHDGYFWENAVSKDAGVRDSEGGGDLAFGFKIKLWDEDGRLPEAALISHVSIPAGESPFSSERFDPDYRITFTHTMSEQISLAYNLGHIWSTEIDVEGDRDTRPQFQYTAALGIDLNDRLGCFLEFFGDIPTGDSDGPANSFDGGLTYLIADNVQLDVSSGVGLSDNADDWFVGAGFSIRFP